MSLAERLQYARERTGLSQPQVRDRTGIGESSLSEFERAKREPSLSQLHKLAAAYRRSVSFFLAEGPIPTEVVLWREEPESNGGGTSAHFLQLCAQYYNLEVWTKEEAPVSLPDAREDAAEYTYRHAEALAKKVRDQLDLGDRPGLSLLPVLEEVCGVKVFHLDFQPTGTAASTNSSDSFGPAILLNKGNVRWRRNFDLAHELFHLLTWRIFRRTVGSDVTSDRAGAAEEKLAQCFAGNLLMPSDAVHAALTAKMRNETLAFDDVFDVARQFDVSVEALLWRMQTLRMLKGTQKETRTLIARSHELAPILEERPKQPPPSTFPERYKALAIKALRHGLISKGRFAEYLEISRRQALKYAEQEITDDEEVPLAPA